MRNQTVLLIVFAGLVFFPQSVFGDITIRKSGSQTLVVDDDGTIRQSGKKVGSIDASGNVRKSGSSIGRIDSNGTIRRSGSKIGTIKANGRIYKSGKCCWGDGRQWRHSKKRQSVGERFRL